MMKRIYILLFLCSGFGLSAQQTISSQFLYLSDVNPSFISENKQTTYSIFSKKIQGINESPTTEIIGYSNVINESTIIGCSFHNTSYGISSVGGLKVNYAHIINFSNFQISLGIQGEARRYMVDESLFILDDPNDNAISGVLEKRILSEAATSLYFKSNKFDFGISVFNLMNSKAKLESFVSDDKKKINFNITANYHLYITENIKLNPSIFLMKEGEQNLSAYLMILSTINNNLKIGAFYTKNIGVIAGVKSGNLNLNYSHSFPSSEISSYSVGSDEISISIDF